MGRRRSRSPSVLRTPTHRSRSPTPIGRDRSGSHDHAFADAVHDLVDEVHYATSRRGRARGKFLAHLIVQCSPIFAAKLLGDDFYPLGRTSSFRRDSKRTSHSPWRGPAASAERDSRSISPEYRTTCLNKPSRSPSPKMRSPPKQLDYYGTTQLERRSRSPSPVSSYATPFRRLAARFTGGRHSRRLPPVPPPSYPDIIDIEEAGIHYPSELEQRSRSPSPSSVYSMSEYFRRPRLRRLPPAPGISGQTSSGGIHTSERDFDPFSAVGAGGSLMTSGRTGSSSCFRLLTPGLPTPRPPSATSATYPAAQSIHLLDTDDPLSIPSYHEAIQLPTLSHSPTIPHPETRSPTAINFPRVCSSPTHGATPTNNPEGLMV